MIKSFHHWYKLKNNTKKKTYCYKGIRYEKNMKNLHNAAVSKKTSVECFTHKKHCDTITKDMKYIDKKYKLNK